MAWSTIILGGGRRATRTNRMQAMKRPVPVGHWSTLKEYTPPTAILAGYLKIGSDHVKVDAGGVPIAGLKGGLS